MTLPWWKTDSIIESEARDIHTRARTAYDYLQEQKAEREKLERERKVKAEAEGQRTLGEWRGTGAKWFPATSLVLAGIQKEEERKREAARELQGFDIEPTSLNIQRQIDAMYGYQPEGRYNWAQQVTTEAKIEEDKAKAKEAEAESKAKATIIAKLRKDEEITFDTPLELIEEMVNERLAKQRSDEALAVGDIEKAKQYLQVANWWQQYKVLSPEDKQAIMSGTVTPPTPPSAARAEGQPWYKRALYGAAKGIEVVDLPFMLVAKYNDFTSRDPSTLTDAQKEFVSLYEAESKLKTPIAEVEQLYQDNPKVAEMMHHLKRVGGMAGLQLPFITYKPSAELRQSYYGITGTGEQIGESLRTPLGVAIWLIPPAGAARAGLFAKAAGQVAKGTKAGTVAAIGLKTGAGALKPLAYFEKGLAYLPSKAFQKIATRRWTKVQATAWAKLNEETQKTTMRFLDDALKANPALAARATPEAISKIARGADAILRTGPSWEKVAGAKYGLTALPSGISSYSELATKTYIKWALEFASPAKTEMAVKLLAKAGFPREAIAKMSVEKAWESLIAKLGAVGVYESLIELYEPAVATAEPTAAEPVAEVTKEVAAPEVSTERVAPVTPEVLTPAEAQELRGLKVVIANLQDQQARGLVLDVGAREQLASSLKRQAELTRAAIPTAEAGVAKEPWQMGQKEFVGEARNLYPDRLLAHPETYHKGLIKKALAEGKSVPAEVVAEYPDLLETTAATEFGTITGEIPEGGVTVSGLEMTTLKVSKSLGKVNKAYRTRLANRDKIKAEVVAEVQKELRDIKGAIPYAKANRLLTQVKIAKTEKSLVNATNKIKDILDEVVTARYIAQVRKELSGITPKKQGKFLKTKYTAETQDLLSQIKANMNLDHSAALAQIDRNIIAAAEGKMAEEDMRIANMVLENSGIRGMSLEEAKNALATIQEIKATGSTERLRRIFNFKEERDSYARMVLDTVTGGKGLREGVGYIPAKELEKSNTKFQKVLQWNYGLSEVADILDSGAKGTESYAGPVTRFMDKIIVAGRRLENGGGQEKIALVIGILEKKYGLKGNQMHRQVDALRNDIINLGDFKLANGKTRNFSYTKGQLMEKYAQLQNEPLAPTFDNSEGMAYTDEVKNAIRESLSPEDIKVVDAVMKDYYDEDFVAISEAAENYGILVRKLEKYFPISREVSVKPRMDLPTAENLSDVASILNNSLIARVSSKAPLRYGDFLSDTMEHIQKMEHFKAWAEGYKLLRSVFRQPDVVAAIKQYKGTNVYRELNAQLNDIARGARMRQEMIHELDRALTAIRRRFTVGVLTKPIIAAKQFLSSLAYMTELSTTDFVGGINDFWKAPIEHGRFLIQHSPTLRARFGEGWERDVRLANTRSLAQILARQKNLSQRLMAGVGLNSP